MKILVVEDDQNVAQILKLLLSSYSYAVDIGTDGETGFQMVDAFEYDLVVMDVMLPGLDGISLCEQIRAKGLKMPILLLTGQGGARQKAIALNAGADDYVVKPFDSEELMARVQALLRRGGAVNQPVLVWGNLRVDPSSRKVNYGTHLLSLTPKELAILELFLRHNQQVFSARAILDHAWSSLESPGEEAIRVHIKELRQKLTAVGAPKDFIKTVYRVGYRLNPLYSSALAAETKQLPPLSDIAELKSVNQELRAVLEELQATQAQLQRQNAELEIAHHMLGQELQQRQQMEQQLQAAHDQLEQQVTERTAELVQANSQLQHREQQLQALFDHALDAIAIADDDGNYVDANPAACKLFGVPRSELLRLNIADFADPGSNVGQLWQQFLQQGQMSGEFRLCRPDGTVREADFSAIANFIPHRHLSILRDISDRSRLEAERKQAETDLLEKQHLIEQITNSTSAILYIYDLVDQQNIYVNRQISVVLGYSPAEIQAMGSNLFGNLVHPNDLPRVVAQLEQCLTANDGDWVEIEYRMRHLNGEWRWLQSRDSVLNRTGDGSPKQIMGTAIDITDRKQAEIELQAISDALSNAVEGISRIDSEGNYVSVNDAYARMVGYLPSEMLGMSWQNTVHADDLAAVTAAYQHMLSTGKVEVEARGIRKDGSFFDKQLVMIAAYDEQQQLIGHHCFLKNITERKQQEADRKWAEVALRESKKRFQSAFEYAAIGMALVAPDGRWLQANQSMCEIVGYSEPELLASTSQAMTHPDDLGQDLEYTRQLLAREIRTFQMEKRYFHKLGHLVWVLISVSMVYDPQDQPLYFIAQVQDISDRKRLEAEHRQAEQKIREQAALINIATDAIYVCDLEGRILLWNRGAEQLYGWAAEEALGKNIRTLGLKDLKDEMDSVLSTGFWQGESAKVTKVGKKIIVASRWTLMRDQSGQPKSVLIVNTDITVKKQLEEQFYRAQRLESLGTLTSGIAHDLNNILTPILAISQLMRMSQPDLNERSQEMLAMLENSAKRGTNLVKQIVTFVRGTEGRRIALQVRPLLLEMGKFLVQTWPKSIKIQTAITPQSLGTVYADPTQLHQVLMNLCVNARDAMPNGGVLTLSAENRCVDDSFADLNLEAQVGDYLVVTVSDTGTGIPPEIRDRIFDPFFTTKAPGKGTGLGLSTVLGIIKSYGGFVQVFSQVEQGTQFHVYLPIIEETITEHQPAKELPQGQGELVLIVDDDIDVQRTNQALLESYGYKTLTANDGIEAIDHYTKQQDEIQVILIDIMMPKMDGITAVRALKKINPQVKIIAISGLSSNQEPVLTAGASLFLSKPYATEDLLSNLYDLINA